MRIRQVSEYRVTVQPDGKWWVDYVSGTDYLVNTKSVASGKATDQRRGELAARCAIEDHKAKRGKERVEASMVERFTVQG